MFSTAPPSSPPAHPFTRVDLVTTVGRSRTSIRTRASPGTRTYARGDDQLRELVRRTTARACWPPRRRRRSPSIFLDSTYPRRLPRDEHAVDQLGRRQRLAAGRRQPARQLVHEALRRQIGTGLTPTLNACFASASCSAPARAGPACSRHRHPGGYIPAGQPDPITVSCQKNYHILFTDGFTNQCRRWSCPVRLGHGVGDRRRRRAGNVPQGPGPVPAASCPGYFPPHPARCHPR